MSEPEIPIGETQFLSHLPAHFAKRADLSLADLSQETFRRQEMFASNLNRRIDDAWARPIRQLTCEEVRSLANQGVGFEWLAEPIAEFVVRHPRAQITHYPGDLAIAVWSEFDKFRAASSQAAEKLLSADFSWMPERYSFDRSLTREAEALILASQERS